MKKRNQLRYLITIFFLSASSGYLCDKAYSDGVDPIIPQCLDKAHASCRGLHEGIDKCEFCFYHECLCASGQPLFKSNCLTGPYCNDYVRAPSSQPDNSRQEQQSVDKQQGQAQPEPIKKKGCEEGYSARAFTGECQPTVQVLKFGKTKEEIQQEQARLEQERLEQERPERERLERIRQEAEEKQLLEDEWIKMSSQIYPKSAFQGSPAQGQNVGLAQPSPAQQALDKEVDEKIPCGWRCMREMAWNKVTKPIKDVAAAVKSVREFLSGVVDCPDPGEHPTVQQKIEYNKCNGRNMAATFWNPFRTVDQYGKEGEVVGRDLGGERE